MTQSAFDADCYNMNHRRRGVAVIFNNKYFDPATNMGERSGTDVDMQNLFQLFGEMGFQVVVKNDCTAQEMESFMVKGNAAPKKQQQKWSPAFNGHLCYSATLFLSLCSTFPIKTICPKRPSVLYSH
jgi:hypothetical protein